MEQHQQEFLNFLRAIPIPFNFSSGISGSVVRRTKCQQFSDPESFPGNFRTRIFSFNGKRPVFCRIIIFYYK